ncbi:hypothetical protein M0R45_001414 [Rubus argutus]|uniref:Cyclic nucleotide-binding domain-containing protein n=1 Tax=Rubus argutus TaxID=59490 RepID=A0AAW1VLI8_RUBAR
MKSTSGNHVAIDVENHELHTVEAKGWFGKTFSVLNPDCEFVRRWNKIFILTSLQVRRAELFRWTATQGIDEEQIIQNLPEHVQRSIRHFLFEFIKKVRIFSMLDEPVLDALCELLRRKTYIQGNEILFPGCILQQMVFIVTGKMEVLRMDGSVESTLEEGNVCGEELLAWCMDGSLHGRLLTATTRVRCLTDVEAFHLPVADLDRFTKRFATTCGVLGFKELSGTNHHIGEGLQQVGFNRHGE